MQRVFAECSYRVVAIFGRGEGTVQQVAAPDMAHLQKRPYGPGQREKGFVKRAGMQGRHAGELGRYAEEE